MKINLDNEENELFLYHQPEVIKNESFQKWEYWLHQIIAPFDTKTRCGTVYKTPMTDSDRADIYHFMEQIQVIIASGCKDVSDRANRIIELAVKHQDDFKNFNSFSHFYFLFEFSPENQITMDELGLILMDLTRLVKKEGLSSSDYFWAAESIDGLGNNLTVSIQAVNK